MGDDCINNCANKSCFAVSSVAGGRQAENDVMSAIQLAIALNFRAAVSKTFVLVPCSSCGSLSLQVCRFFLFFSFLVVFMIFLLFWLDFLRLIDCLARFYRLDWLLLLSCLLELSFYSFIGWLGRLPVAVAVADAHRAGRHAAYYRQWRVPVQQSPCQSPVPRLVFPVFRQCSAYAWFTLIA